MNKDISPKLTLEIINIERDTKLYFFFFITQILYIF